MNFINLIGLPRFSVLYFGTTHWCTEFPWRIFNSRRWSSPSKNIQMSIDVCLYIRVHIYVCMYTQTCMYIWLYVYACNLQAAFLQSCFSIIKQSLEEEWRNKYCKDYVLLSRACCSSMVNFTHVSWDRYSPKSLWRPKVVYFPWLTPILSWDCKAGLVMLSQCEVLPVGD